MSGVSTKSNVVHRTAFCCCVKGWIIRWNSAAFWAVGLGHWVILNADGVQQAAVLWATGFCVGLEIIIGVASGADGRTMSLQYFETLKSLGDSPSTKWIFPMEFTSMLGNFMGMGNQSNGDDDSR